jgi:hypothetical protein
MRRGDTYKLGLERVGERREHYVNPSWKGLRPFFVSSRPLCMGMHVRAQIYKLNSIVLTLPLDSTPFCGTTIIGAGAGVTGHEDVD